VVTGPKKKGKKIAIEINQGRTGAVTSDDRHHHRKEKKRTGAYRGKFADKAFDTREKCLRHPRNGECGLEVSKEFFLFLEGESDRTRKLLENIISARKGGGGGKTVEI